MSGSEPNLNPVAEFDNAEDLSPDELAEVFRLTRGPDDPWDADEAWEDGGVPVTDPAELEAYFAAPLPPISPEAERAVERDIAEWNAAVAQVRAARPAIEFLGSRVITLRDILTTELPPVEWDVEPLIARGQRVMVIGQWGAFKSWLLQNLALHLATGRPWLGFNVPGRRSVLYVDKEMSSHLAVRRLKQLAKGTDVRIDDIDGVSFRLVSHPQLKMDSAGGEHLLRAVESLPNAPQVIIAETFRRLLVGAEKEQEDVTAFWEAVDPIYRAGISLYVGHHMRKPKRKNESNREMASGSTDILAGADGVLAIGREGLSNVCAIEHLKNRDGEEFRDGKPFGLMIAFPTDPAERHTGPVVIMQQPSDAEVNQTKEAEAADRMLEAARGRTESNPITTAELLSIGEKAGVVGKRTRERIIEGLCKRGDLKRPATGKYYAA